MTAWAHLPNARHIDAVLAHAEAHPERWETAWVAAWDAAWGTARDAAWAASRDAARAAARAACAAHVARHSALGAYGACAALIAWDDAGLLMDMPVDAVRTLAAAGHHPAILLMPARLAMEEK